MKRLCLLCFLVFYFIPGYAQLKNDTFSVYFDLDVALLNAHSKEKIDKLYYQEKINKTAPIAIVGYADFLASDEYNLDLSQRRANNVKQYLATFGIDVNAIRIVIGRGEVKRKDTMGRSKGVQDDRRVDIVMEYTKINSRTQANRMSINDTVIRMKPSEKLITPPATTDSGFDITLIPPGKTFILNNIYFPMGRHFPRETSFDELNMLLAFMKEYPHAAIKIEGHVCCISNVPDAYDLDSHDLDLSVNRARFIYEYLKARGVDSSRLQYAGYGKTRPIIADEQTQEDAAKNRRVEIRILRK